MKRYDIYESDTEFFDEVESSTGHYVHYRDAARIIAQRDRLAELMRRLVADADIEGPWSDAYCSTFNKIHAALAELDKEKQSHGN